MPAAIRRIGKNGLEFIARRVSQRVSSETAPGGTQPAGQAFLHWCSSPRVSCARKILRDVPSGPRCSLPNRLAYPATLYPSHPTVRRVPREGGQRHRVLPRPLDARALSGNGFQRGGCIDWDLRRSVEQQRVQSPHDRAGMPMPVHDGDFHSWRHRWRPRVDDGSRQRAQDPPQPPGRREPRSESKRPPLRIPDAATRPTWCRWGQLRTRRASQSKGPGLGIHVARDPSTPARVFRLARIGLFSPLHPESPSPPGRYWPAAFHGESGFSATNSNNVGFRK